VVPASPPERKMIDLSGIPLANPTTPKKMVDLGYSRMETKAYILLVVYLSCNAKILLP
jgi:hypothetical protein